MQLDISVDFIGVLRIFFKTSKRLSTVTVPSCLATNIRDARRLADAAERRIDDE